MKNFFNAFLLSFGLWSIAYSQSTEVNLDDTMSAMKKRKMVLEYLELTEAEKVAFWPLYEEYDKAIEPIETESLSLIRLCSGDEPEPKDFEKYSRRLLLNDLVLAKVRREYFTKFRAGLSGLRASQFFQFDDSYRMMLRFEAQQTPSRRVATSVNQSMSHLIN